MTPSEIAAAASRLCLDCGMCCNGVLFQIVRLQPGDSVRELESLGLKLSRKKREPYFRQPCDKLKECTCSIYESRPLRCRFFECRQLHRLENKEASEEEIARVIESAKSAVKNVETLLVEAGNESLHLPLSERYDQVMASESADENLREAMEGLQQILNADFRMGPL
jgi:uncharacterized protein